MSTPSDSPPPETSHDLLRQLLDVQRELLALQKQAAAAHDHGSRWRAYLARWQQDFPELPEACKSAVPILERSYGALIAELAEHLRQNGNGSLDNEFVLGEFLDRYGMRLSQLGTILSLVAFLAEASNPPQAQSEE
jgi:HPt (histidine-containing phosphotransfer) domain-containing protein